MAASYVHKPEYIGQVFPVTQVETFEDGVKKISVELPDGHIASVRASVGVSIPTAVMIVAWDEDHGCYMLIPPPPILPMLDVPPVT
ncbi:hypothetical protein J7643_19175 [bacterium]|nr:hypothetical protein [bacterium]